MFASLAVYCGPSPGHDPKYPALAYALGGLLAQRGIRLVYGGGGVGMMGAVADGVLAAGGRVTGVIPTFLNTRELQHPRVTDMRVVETMHERKQIMATESDGFMALPGGFGTMDELFEVLTWSQLAIHDRPVGVLNVDGFFDGVLMNLNVMVERGFLRQEDRDRVLSADSPGLLLESMAVWKPPGTLKFTLAR